MKRRARFTLAAPSAILQGVGLHSGSVVSLRLLPASDGAGLVFHDRTIGQEIPALAANVIDTSRCTRLGANGAEVQTVEHVLSALAGMGVDDAVIELTGGEAPAGDGSAAPFVALIEGVGLREQETAASALVLSQPLVVTEGSASIIALPGDRFSATVVLDYPRHAYLGTLAAVFEEASDDYAAMIAPARTFGFLSELDALRARGLGLGATRDNAVVLGEDHYETPLRFSNELARHKLLDLIGDLALIGQPLQASIFAVKPSHALNVRLAGLLLSNLHENC